MLSTFGVNDAARSDLGSVGGLAGRQRSDPSDDLWQVASRILWQVQDDEDRRRASPRTVRELACQAPQRRP